MRFLLFLILARYAVRCDDESNYYVIEMPEDLPRDYKKPFRVYWNVPTMQCKSKKIPFDNLHEKYGIIQNKDDKFLGEDIAILYDPGLFPALFKNESSGKFKFRNGGVPQEGALDQHLDAFKSTVSQSIPDPDFSGVAIIDFESWRPVFRQNFGVLVPYKDVSYEIERKVHWWWPRSWIIAEAKQRFEDSARRFMQTTISVAKQIRPKAIWGYYGFPYCFNKASNMIDSCPSQVVAENDETYWLWAESTALYPSIYSSQDLSSSELSALIQGRVREASRVRRRGTPILPYFWYRYQDGGFLRELDLSIALQTLYKSNASGFIIWGSSHDVNTIDKCNKLKNYLETTLGPYISKYTKDIHKMRDEYTPEPTDIWHTKPNLNKTDPEFNWIPPENYTHDIIKNVEEELIKKGYDDFNHTKVNESVVLEMLSSIRQKDEIDKDIVKNDKNSKIEVTSPIIYTTTNLTTLLDANKNMEITQSTIEIVDSPTNTNQEFKITELFKLQSTESVSTETTTMTNSELKSTELNSESTTNTDQEPKTTEAMKSETIANSEFRTTELNTESTKNQEFKTTESYTSTTNTNQESKTTEPYTSTTKENNFLVLFTNISQFEITTEDSISSKKPRSITEFEKDLENSTFHLLTPNDDEEGDFSNAAISSYDSILYVFGICVVFMFY